MNNSDSNIEKLAKKLAKKDLSGLRDARLFQAYLINDNIEILKNNCNVEDKQFQSIGTWHPEKIDGEMVFIRKEQRDSTCWESSRLQIKQKKKAGMKRICVIGESAAYGMFFSPYYTPTKALDLYMNQNKDTKWDVIDLTRIGMQAKTFLETCSSSLQLDSDYVVLFAGNNWYSDAVFKYDAPNSKRKKFIKILNRDGIKGVIDSYKGDFEKHTEDIIKSIANIFKNSATKVLFMIPAANYENWERQTPCYWLGDDKTSRWYELYESALKCNERKEYSEMLKIGKYMISLDAGYSPTSNRIIANSLIRLGKKTEARKYCEAEIDYSLMYDQMTSFPSTPSFIRKKIAELSEVYNMQIFDLERVFDDYLNSSIPRKTVFIDYCHMNPAGFNIAMAPVAAHILNNEPKGTDFNSAKLIQLTEKKQGVDRFQLAISYFYIAIYNTHLNQPVSENIEIEEYTKLFQHAVETSEKVLYVMEDYLRARICGGGAGFNLSKYMKKLLNLTSTTFDLRIAQLSPGTDRITVEAICTVLENNGRQGKALMKKYQQYFINILNRNGVDLSEPQYIERINAVVALEKDHEISTRRKLPYFKARFPKSHFTLVSDAKSELEFEITCRFKTQNIGKQSIAKVLVNGKRIADIKIKSTWCKTVGVIPKKVLKCGYNKISVEWPSLSQDEEKEIDNISDRYLLGVLVDIFPVHGEIFSLWIR